MSTPTIRQLPDQVANQIAAGEVLERPAAAVKELVENSLDAGADDIDIRIEDGGRRLIEIVDNGHGMQPDDLRLAFGRHATSKLQQADDLFCIGSLGFRGEALPSIAAVSECELASHPADHTGGQMIRIAAGKELAFGPEAMPAGTRMTVRNLFWNVPARLKFLKSKGTETGHITDMVTRLALGHPRVAFRLHVDGRCTLELPTVRELTTRIRSCFGRNLADALIPIEGHTEAMQLTGFIAHPSQAKPSAKRQFVFLNGRHVRDKLLMAAIREGYRGYMEPRLHPAVVVHIDCDPALVDVNVHPTKSEVRFRQEKEIFHLLRSTLQTTLKEHVGGFILLDSASPTTVANEISKRTVVKAAEPAIQERFLPTNTGRSEAAAPVSAGPTPTAAATSVRASGSSYQSTPPTTDAADAAPAYSVDQRVPGVHRVSQIHDMYLLIETETGLRIVDQHALHEKALWLVLAPEATRFEAGGRQERLIPQTIELSAAEIAALEPQLPRLRQHGIEAEVFGPTTIALRAMPAMLAKVNWTSFFTDLATHGPGQDAIERLREAIGHRAACRAAIKAGHRLTQDEQWEFVRLLYSIDGLEHCPHGRPTTLDLSWPELERRFQR